jgi:methylase of polypeptide subunit release factors
LRTLVSMREALSDPGYFGSVLAGPTWDAWRVLLIAIMGEPLNVEELATFALLTGRTASPAEPVEAFWAVIGRRGGKTRAIAVLASYLAGCVDHRNILGPGERGIRFIESLAAGAAVLDLGCGSGRPVAQHMAERGLRVTGIDSSPAMISVCRTRLPDHEWIVADLRALSLRRRFDGVLAWDQYY